MKILVIHSFGMGDMIMFTPALKELQKQFPKAQIDFLVFQHFSVEPIKNNDYIHKIYFSNFNLKSLLNTIIEIRKYKYDISFFTTGVKYYKNFLFSLFLNSKQKIIEYTNFYIPFPQTVLIKREEDEHFVMNNLKIIDIFSTIDFEKNHTIKYWLDNIQNELPVRQKIIGIHPGCNIKFKQRRWHIEYYIELIHIMLNKCHNYKIVIFIGPDEKEELKILRDEFTTSVEFIENKRLEDVARHISLCELFISNDSGLGHIAACFNVNIVTIKSHSSNANLLTTAVYTNKNKIIEFFKEDINQSQKVFSEIRKIIQCAE